MGKTKKETKEPASSIPAKAISKRILVAEDNQALRDVVSEILDFMGFEVSFTANGVEALAAFVDRSFDLVLTDLEMPLMDGWRLTHSIKEKSPNTPIVWMTGSDRKAVLKEMEGKPVASVLFKPFRTTDLENAVTGALTFKEGEQGSVGSAQGHRY